MREGLSQARRLRNEKPWSNHCPAARFEVFFTISEQYDKVSLPWPLIDGPVE